FNNYLPLFRFGFPTQGRPYHSFGLLARGVYRVPPGLFPTRFVTVALSSVLVHIVSDTGVSAAVSRLATLTYDFVKHEHYKHHSLCEYGLSSADKLQRLREYSSFHNKYYNIK